MKAGRRNTTQKRTTAAKGSLSGKVHANSGAGSALGGVSVRAGGKSDTTGNNGKFKLDGIAAGSTTVAFSKSGYESYQGSVNIAAGKTADMGERWLTEKATPVPAQPPPTAKGSVSGKLHKNAASGPLLDGVSVRAGGKSDTTGRDGKFKIEGLAGGNATVTFSKAGYESYQGSVNIAAGKNADTGDRWLTEKIQSAVGEVYSLASDCPANGYDKVGEVKSRDPWGFYKCECTSYVAAKLIARGVPFRNSYKIARWGAAKEWKEHAESANINSDKNPRQGDVAWFDYGHVAYVDSVDANGNITISEYNLGYPTRPYRYSNRSLKRGARGYPNLFIHI